MTTAILETTEQGETARRPLPDTSSITVPLPVAELREAIAEIVDLAEDLAVAEVVRARLTIHEDDDALSLVEFIRGEGFDPADFGVE